MKVQSIITHAAVKSVIMDYCLNLVLILNMAKTRVYARYVL